MNFTPAEPRVIREEPRTFLARIRGQSCYKALRVLIDLSTVLLAVAGLVNVTLGMIVFINFAGEQGSVRFLGYYTVTTASAPEVFVAGLVLLAIAIPYRQGSLLLLDIADMLIERGRKEWNFDQPVQMGGFGSAAKTEDSPIVKRP